MKSFTLKSMILLLGCMTFFTANAQTAGKDEVLFTVAGQPVTKEEFLYVYKKNNPDKQNDYSSESLREYLDLYVNFKLKVTEARAEKIDTTEKVREELQKYGDQLIKSNFDKEVLEGAAQRMYDRMQSERLVYHIMIGIDPKANGADTAAAIAKLTAARERLLKGEDFGKVAAEVSTDKSSPDNPGFVGWVVPGQINDLTFENTVFSTAPGNISNVIKSRYGYHIVKVAKERSSMGTVTVEHILVRVPDNAKPEDFAKAKVRIDSIAAQIKAGNGSFEEMAAKYSDDKMTAQNGGKLESFGTGKLANDFQEAAFALKNPGDISAPVKTSKGWHLIKLIERKPMGTYAEMKDELKGKIERSPEYKELRADFVSKAKAKYGFTENADAKKEMYAIMDSSFVKNSWTMNKAGNMNKPMFTIGDKSMSQADFASFLEINQRSSRDKSIEEKFSKLYTQAVEQTVIEYDLSERNIDFRRLLQEYRDGLPLFAMLERKIWSKGSTDSVGLKNYYEQHKTEYMWEERIDASIYTCKDTKTAKAVRKMASKHASTESILAKFNKDSLELVTVKSGLYMTGQDSNIDKMNKQTGIGEDILNADGTITFVQINKIVPPTPKTLDEARGYVISAYQDQLEKEWIAELHKKYPVAINEKVFNSMVH
ncbi:MAG TPA: peptidylprolyl isomerase [Chitinophagales bacterium]|nr:peptidyl-prolyl cis-trans isomerase [Chitinophagales bacterium]HMZ88049.1 peptidylprolyl isomerase [Chitinophagales bacterium]HNA56597.1 peptidylprolyl isomerase [Chitinophagales bacterium]HNE46076.1 peptidylprolyl isomerase [Chitinophagales bacterium]HNF68323.1 peptidylprolyl isomerase [Chitinophagales bacterium]